MGMPNHHGKHHGLGQLPNRLQLPRLHSYRHRLHLHTRQLLHDNNSHRKKQYVQIHNNTLAFENRSSSFSCSNTVYVWVGPAEVNPSRSWTSMGLYWHPLIQPEMPSSLTVICTGSGSSDLYIPLSSSYNILGLRMKVPRASGFRSSFTSPVFNGSRCLPSRCNLYG